MSARPFIPSWLDDAGLSAVQFRVYCHLWRRADADCLCWPSAPSIAEACRINKDSVWPALAALEAAGLLSREKGAGNSNRYLLRVGGKEGVTVGGKEGVTQEGESAEREGLLSAEKEGRHPAEKRGWQSAEKEGRKGNPEKVPQRRFSKEGEKRRRADDAEAVQFPLVLSSPDFAAAWAEWTQHRKEIRKPLTPTSVRQQLAKLEAIGASRAIEAIRHSLANGWQGIFEPKSQEQARRSSFGVSNKSGYGESTDISNL